MRVASACNSLRMPSRRNSCSRETLRTSCRSFWSARFSRLPQRPHQILLPARELVHPNAHFLDLLDEVVVIAHFLFCRSQRLVTNHWGESIRDEFGDGEASVQAAKRAPTARGRCARATQAHLRSSANPAFPCLKAQCPRAVRAGLAQHRAQTQWNWERDWNWERLELTGAATPQRRITPQRRMTRPETVGQRRQRTSRHNIPSSRKCAPGSLPQKATASELRPVRGPTASWRCHHRWPPWLQHQSYKQPRDRQGRNRPCRRDSRSP